LATRPSFQAFTVKAKTGRLNRIITEISVRAAFDPTNPPHPVPAGIKSKALWDTGATHSVVSIELAKALSLKPVGVSNVTHGGGKGTSPRYVVNFELPHSVGVVGVLVTEFPEPDDKAFSVIVGMDVICLGDFCISNHGGVTWVTFRTPPYESIDYVAQANKLAFAGAVRQRQEVQEMSQTVASRSMNEPGAPRTPHRSIS
jgi:hypothetical protein